MIARAISIPESSVSDAPFPDLPAGHWSTGSVAALADQEIITGYTDGTFRPSGPVHRSEAVAMLLRAQGKVPAGTQYDHIKQTAVSPFSDVSSSYWAFVYIMRAYGVA